LAGIELQELKVTTQVYPVLKLGNGEAELVPKFSQMSSCRGADKHRNNLAFYFMFTIPSLLQTPVVVIPVSVTFVVM
jgi:hypothetical protein